MCLRIRRTAMMNSQELPEMLTAHEVAEILKISYPQALSFIKYGNLDYIKVGNQYRVCKHKLIDFLNKKGSQVIYLN